ncbi:MAG: hypothetical protein ACKVP3_26865 [Hyphomicrobiaceae bacterium]
MSKTSKISEVMEIRDLSTNEIEAISGAALGSFLKSMIPLLKLSVSSKTPAAAA